jgi:DNA-directed RNA polymerase specialized sigma24 family protein
LTGFQDNCCKKARLDSFIFFLPGPLTKPARKPPVSLRAPRTKRAKKVRVSTPDKISLPVAQDRLLVERCLAGEIGAWSQIYRQFHESLLASIRSFLGRGGQDANLVEEIAARVWYALVKNDFELLGKFDVARGCRLSTFLSVLAKNETRVLLRSERRRRNREQLVSRAEFDRDRSAEAGDVLSDEEFLVTLSRAERSFYLDVLVGRPESNEQAAQSYSRQNLWQLRHRIRKKLERFILETGS